MQHPEEPTVVAPNDVKNMRVLLLILLIAPPIIILFLGLAISISGSNY